jgi:peptidoglycan/LPS O-acetylase OafA/YrhL
MLAMQLSDRNHHGSSLPMVDLAKAMASQLIVWHHLALYGPMSDVVGDRMGELTTALMAWLVEQARLAVQVFLVMGGFLAARSMLPTPDAPAGAFPRALPGVLLRRWQRLAPLYGVALLAAVVCAALARALIDSPATPEAPTVWQVVANVLMLQDILGQEALSAGIWYVAVDLQLFAVLALLCALRTGCRWATAPVIVALTAVSLLWFNREPALDVWAPYFLGAYGLGVMAQWANATGQRGRWAVAIMVLTALALLVEWRSRLALAGCVALVLALGIGQNWRWLALGPLRTPIAALSRISYAVFLLHYPVMLAVGAVFYRAWPDSPPLQLLGLWVAWAVGLAVGWWLERQTSTPARRHPSLLQRRP